MNYLLVITITTLLITLVGCGDKEKSGRSIGAPKIKPPVENNMPAGFKSAALALENSEGFVSKNPISSIKDYFFPAGDFVGPLERLGFIDGRMDELNKRSEDSAKKCLDLVPEAFDIGAMLPGSVSFVQKYNCQETLGVPPGQGIKNQVMAFGLADGIFYLNEHRYDDDGSAIVVLVQASQDGKTTEVWDVRWNAGSGQADILHIKGDDNTGGVEVTSSSNLDGTGAGDLSCGIHARSNANYLYFSGKIAAGSSCGEAQTLCIDATTLVETETTKCSEAGLDTFALSTLNPENMAASIENIKLIAAKEITGFTDFNEDAPE